MAYLTKLQVKQILDKAPPELDKGKIIESLVSQGHELEGFNEVPKQEGLITRAAKGVVKAVANPLLRLGATGDALSTSKYLGGKGTNNDAKKTPLGDIKPITTAKDAAGVGAELIATGVGFGGAGTAGRFGAKFLGSAGVGALSGAGQKLQNANSTIKDVLKGAGAGAAIGGAIPVAGEALSLAKRFIGSVAKGTAASLSGAGSDAIEAVVSNPRAARAGLRGDATETIKDLSTTVRRQVSALAKEAEDEYGAAVADLPKRLGRNPEILTAGQKTTIKADGKTYQLSMQGVKSKLTQELRNFGVEVNPRKPEFDFLESPFVDSDEKTLKKVFDVIHSWRDTTPEGLNNLAIKIGKYRKTGVQSPELNSVIDATKRGVRNYIGDRVPAVRALNGKYSQAQDFINAIDQEIGTNGKFIGGTSEQIATAKKLSTIFNKNKELARELVARLEGGKDILAKEAGRELSAGVSRSGASIGDLTRGAVQSIVPPRVLGEVAAATGIAHENLAPILASLKILQPAERTALLQLLSHSLIGDFQSDELSVDQSSQEELLPQE
jgi:hypothetical protein